jgi:hypothetical protein
MRVAKLACTATLLCFLTLNYGNTRVEASFKNNDIKPSAERSMESEQTKKLMETYSKVTGDIRIINAIESMIGTSGAFSKKAILGENLSGRPIKVYFYDLSTIDKNYYNYDALGMKKGKNLYIYINQKHYNAPPEALSALLSHEALHQDEYNSINEETYAWTMEATVWHEQLKKNPDIKNYQGSELVSRENILNKMLEVGEFSNRLIRNAVTTNPGYQGLPAKSPGFENVE